METEFSIQQVAQQTGLSIDTLRYYERIGLIEPIHRASNNHRRYAREDVDWIALLIRLKETGMPIAQMTRFAQLRRQGPCTLTERRIMLEQHQRDLEQQIQQLDQHRSILQLKIASYKEREAQFIASSPSAQSPDTAMKQEE
jgi:DNA-binding transcriptional MerR regulator